AGQIDKAAGFFLKLPAFLRTQSVLIKRRAQYLLMQKKYKDVLNQLENVDFTVSEWRQDMVELFRETCFAWAVDLKNRGENKKAVKAIYRYSMLPSALRLMDEKAFTNSAAYYLLLLWGEKKDWRGRSIAHEIRNEALYFELFTDVKYYYTFARCLELTGNNKRAESIYKQMLVFSNKCDINYPYMKNWWTMLRALAYKGQAKKEKAGKLLKICLDSPNPQPFLEFELESL
ncbi:MAG: hypothetical protein ABIA63_00870, partial [bacterium]